MGHPPGARARTARRRTASCGARTAWRSRRGTPSSPSSFYSPSPPSCGARPRRRTSCWRAAGSTRSSTRRPTCSTRPPPTRRVLGASRGHEVPRAHFRQVSQTQRGKVPRRARPRRRDVADVRPAGRRRAGRGVSRRPVAYSERRDERVLREIGEGRRQAPRAKRRGSIGSRAGRLVPVDHSTAPPPRRDSPLPRRRLPSLPVAVGEPRSQFSLCSFAGADRPCPAKEPLFLLAGLPRLRSASRDSRCSTAAAERWRLRKWATKAFSRRRPG